MSKIICELCGTAYPDTADCCPTCGTAKPETAEFSPPVQEEPAAKREYTPTKGGRFSDANVRKRLKSKGIAPAPVHREPRPRQERPAEPRQERPAEPRQERPQRQPKKETGSNKGLTIAAVILILAIIGMVFYIYITFLAPRPGPEQPGNTQSNQAHQQLPQIPQQTQESTGEPDLRCRSLIKSESVIRIDQVGGSWLLNVVPEPANTVDAITYVSADPNVATVSADGKVTAVASGETVITITCGTVKDECKVICDIAPPTTVPETTVPETTVAKADFRLNREDITFDGSGQSWQLYKGEIPLTDITWSTSNSAVAIIKNGVVKAVGPGKCTVTAEYNGQTAACIIRCDFN